MADHSGQDGRLQLAGALRRSADHYLSEQVLRDALSRSYYSVFHLGCALLGKGYGNHDEFLKDLRKRVNNDDLSQTVERLREWRITADYKFDAVTRDYSGDPERFRNAASEALRQGQDVYRELAEQFGKE
ncbi:MAG TPA: hypothetical protein VFQ24_18820 [Terriglobia bacterium]|nr:hypothetical protein [Terriglobia bacterium]